VKKKSVSSVDVMAGDCDEANEGDALNMRGSEQNTSRRVVLIR
jgi:hypothetical protein